MLESGVGILGFLVILVISCLILLNYLLFRAYYRQEKVQIHRLKGFENLVKQEIHRSQSLSRSVNHLQEIKTNTDEKLEVIKLQVEGMKGLEKLANSSERSSQDNFTLD